MGKVSEYAVDKIKTAVICLPRTKINTIDNFLRSKAVNEYEIFFSIDEFFDSIDSFESTYVYLFDFIGELRFRDKFTINKSVFSGVSVFTNIDSVAELSKTISDDVYLLSDMLDILSLFWGTEVFKYDNVAKAREKGIELVNTHELDNSNIDIKQLKLTFEVTKEKTSKYDAPVSSIVISKKVYGVENSKEKKKGFISKLKDLLIVEKQKFNVELDEQDRLYSEEESEYRDDNQFQYRLERDNLLDIASKLQKSVDSSIIGYMLNTDRISKEVYKTLENLKAMNKISGVFGEVDYLVENGYIDEYDSINIVNDYYHINCLQEEEVLHRKVLLQDFKIEGCREFKCFCTRGIRSDVYYFVIDPDNISGKEKISSMFESFSFLYTKEKYILKKLSEMEVI